MVENPHGSGSQTAVSQVERRTHPRRQLSASVEVIEAESGQRRTGRLSDLGLGGCYMMTTDVLPIGAVAKVEITRDSHTIKAEARVVSTQAGKGMGLEFISLPADDLESLTAWLDEALSTSWLASNRRTSQRIQISIPVRVSGSNVAGVRFEEMSKTLSVAVNGGLLLISTPVTKGQRLVLSRPGSEDALECAVVYVKQSQGNFFETGVSFVWPNPNFWGVHFPPADWSPQHPDAKRTSSRSQPK
ncbi:MAG: PilZ domain-containing protein [Candidatus Acidiferrales bacterium]